jgi:cell division transport system ATP-binding protein
MASAFIEFDAVGLRYAGSEQEILKGITLSIHPRSFQFLSGTSGSGKTTILRLMFLALRPTRGKIKLFDLDVDTLSADSIALLRQRIGFVSQDFRLLNHLTVYENVVLPLRLAGRRRERDYREEVIELLQWVGLVDHLEAFPGTLSVGQRQRISIARAVVGRPQIVLADEPTASVDPQLAHQILSLLIELHKSGTSIVISTHDIALMDQYDARRLVLHDGLLHCYD